MPCASSTKTRRRVVEIEPAGSLDGAPDLAVALIAAPAATRSSVGILCKLSGTKGSEPPPRCSGASASWRCVDGVRLAGSAAPKPGRRAVRPGYWVGLLAGWTASPATGLRETDPSLVLGGTNVSVGVFGAASTPWLHQRPDADLAGPRSAIADPRPGRFARTAGAAWTFRSCAVMIGVDVFVPRCPDREALAAPRRSPIAFCTAPGRVPSRCAHRRYCTGLDATNCSARSTSTRPAGHRRDPDRLDTPCSGLVVPASTEIWVRVVGPSAVCRR